MWGSLKGPMLLWSKQGFNFQQYIRISFTKKEQNYFQHISFVLKFKRRPPLGPFNWMSNVFWQPPVKDFVFCCVGHPFMFVPPSYLLFESTIHGLKLEHQHRHSLIFGIAYLFCFVIQIVVVVIWQMQREELSTKKIQSIVDDNWVAMNWSCLMLKNDEYD